MALTDKSRINYEINLRVLSNKLKENAEIMQESIMNARKELEEDRVRLNNDIDISIRGGWE
ncbi:hypothetical protein J4731_09090 [Providencia rettgeri]|nr:hypothetical protein [Providencia rettgeri]